MLIHIFLLLIFHLTIWWDTLSGDARYSSCRSTSLARWLPTSGSGRVTNAECTRQSPMRATRWWGLNLASSSTSRPDAASVVGARVIFWYVIPVTLSRTPSWNRWDNIYIAAHQPNILEPGFVLLVNHVPHFLQRCEDNIDIPYCLQNTSWLCLEATSGSSKAPHTLVGDD